MKLQSQDIHLHFSWPGLITDEDLLRRYRSLLSEAELEQMSRFYFARHRHQFLVTRALVRTCLSGYFQVDPADWRFTKNGYGKPEISHPDESLPVRFNISHSNGLILCGIARNDDIGVDVEDSQRSTRAAFGALSSYFSEQEIADLHDLPSRDQRRRFFDYWTLKESYIKARGKGLSIPLDQFSFHFREDTLCEFRTHPDLGDDAQMWQFWRIPVTDRYRVAVAINSPKPVFRLTAFDTVPLRDAGPMKLTLL